MTDKERFTKAMDPKGYESTAGRAAPELERLSALEAEAAVIQVYLAAAQSKAEVMHLRVEKRGGRVRATAKLWQDQPVEFIMLETTVGLDDEGNP